MKKRAWLSFDGSLSPQFGDGGGSSHSDDNPYLGDTPQIVAFMNYGTDAFAPLTPTETLRIEYGSAPKEFVAVGGEYDVYNGFNISHPQFEDDIPSPCILPYAAISTGNELGRAYDISAYAFRESVNEGTLYVTTVDPGSKSTTTTVFHYHATAKPS